MLDGHRVLDVTDHRGWLAGRLLADLGAEVVKIEAPDGSIDRPDWRAYNVNKRLLRLGLETAADRAAFERLLRRTDVLLDSAPPGSPLADYLGSGHLGRLNSRLVHVSITPFGSAGPRSTWRASDLELMAAGGAMSLAGEPGGTPLRITIPQSPAWAGAQAAVGALIALNHRNATGRGERVDVSAQAAVMLALAHAPAFWDLEASIPTRGGAFITGRSMHGARFRAFWPCIDGHLNFAFYGGSAGRRTNAQLVEWMRSRGAALGALEAVDWNRFDPKLASQEQIDALERPVAAFFLTITKREFLEEASRREMLGYPVSTMRDIASDDQLEARGFWQDLADGAHTRRHGGSVFVVDGTRRPLRYRAGEEVLLADLLSEVERGESVPRDAGGAPA